MKHLLLEEIIRLIDGKVVQGGTFTVTDAATKTDELREGLLVFDVSRGSVPRGKDGSIQAVRNCAVVTDDSAKYLSPGSPLTVVKVKDVGAACWKFVEYYRGLFHLPVIGVTGTCGKTTTKEMIRHILEGRYRVSATVRSLNSRARHFGYLMGFDDQTQAAVIEMGVAVANDLPVACRFFRPQVGVITNVGIDHLMMFGTPEAYLRAKARMLKGLDNRGTLVLNADDENCRKIDLSRYRGVVLTFGSSRSADFRISDIRQEGDNLTFTLTHGDEACPFRIPGYGEFNVFNAAAAVAACFAVGVPVRESAGRLACYQSLERHFEVRKGINGSVVIDDTWSTNPTSVKAALRRMKEISGGKTTIAALGRMHLLGSQSRRYHEEIGVSAAQLGIDRLIVIGADAEAIGLGALRRGMERKNIYFCRNFHEAASLLKKLLDRDSVVLVKTSMMSSSAGLVEHILAAGETPVKTGKAGEEI